MDDEVVLHTLKRSSEPAIGYLTATRLLDEPPTTSKAQKLQQQIPGSASVQNMLAPRDAQGRLPYDAYQKWLGAHWTLVTLAEMGYPPGDEQLRPLQIQMVEWIFAKKYLQYRAKRTIKGRVRMHPSIEGNTIQYSLKLGLDDPHLDELVELILSWRWPDGGWNCSMQPDTTISSFMETLIPMRALALYGKQRKHKAAQEAAREAAEVFLKRQMFKRESTGSVMNHDFVSLHYPCYWHYDILFGLKVMAEMDLIDDPRCEAALDLLESKRLPDGGFPAEKKYYQLSEKTIRSRSAVDWGGTNKKKMNEWVTLDALYVLKSAKRISF